MNKLWQTARDCFKGAEAIRREVMTNLEQCGRAVAYLLIQILQRDVGSSFPETVLPWGQLGSSG